MTGFFLLVGLLMTWMVSPGQEHFAAELRSEHSGAVECVTVEGRGVGKLKTSFYGEDQVGPFDTMVECRRLLMVEEQNQHPDGWFIRNLPLVAEHITKRAHRIKPSSRWFLRQKIQPAVMGEKVFAALSTRFAGAGLQLSLSQSDSFDLCPVEETDEGVLLLMKTEETESLRVGHCENGHAVWWWNDDVE